MGAKLHSLPSFRFVCILCGARFEHDHHLENHLRTEHRTTREAMRRLATSVTGVTQPPGGSDATAD